MKQYIVIAFAILTCLSQFSPLVAFAQLPTFGHCKVSAKISSLFKDNVLCSSGYLISHSGWAITDRCYGSVNEAESVMIRASVCNQSLPSTFGNCQLHKFLHLTYSCPPGSFYYSNNEHKSDVLSGGCITGMQIAYNYMMADSHCH